MEIGWRFSIQWVLSLEMAELYQLMMDMGARVLLLSISPGGLSVVGCNCGGRIIEAKECVTLMTT